MELIRLRSSKCSLEEEWEAGWADLGGWMVMAMEVEEEEVEVGKATPLNLVDLCNIIKDMSSICIIYLSISTKFWKLIIFKNSNGLKSCYLLKKGHINHIREKCIF